MKTERIPPRVEPELAGLAPGSEEDLQVLERRVRALEPVPAKDLERSDAGILLDLLAVRVARGRGALDVRLGRVLNSLTVGDRLMDLSYARLTAYAEEALGISGSVAQGLARLARALQTRPVLRLAVEAGVVSTRKAQSLTKVTGSDPEVEAYWVAQARRLTVRQLESEVAKVTSPVSAAAAAAASEAWAWIDTELSGDERTVVDGAFNLARRLLGAAAPKWQCLEAMCQEYLTSHPEYEPAGETYRTFVPQELQNDLETYVESWAEGWPYLDHTAGPVAVPADPKMTDPIELHAQAVRLVSARERWDDLMGHLAMLIREYELWRDMEFATFAHYCQERLGLGANAVAQRAFVERRCWFEPLLAGALRDGRVGYATGTLTWELGIRHGLPMRSIVTRAEGW